MSDTDKCATHEEKIRQLETRQDKADEVLEKLQNRLPNWATVVMMILSAAVAWFGKGP